MIILGVDPSLSSTGICVMESEIGRVLSCVAIQIDKVGPERLAIFHREFRDIVQKYKEQDDISAFVEGYAFGAKQQREALGELGGVLRLTLHDEGINMTIVQPTSLKKFATGTGKADKIKMGIYLYKEYELEYPTSDQTDAYWLSQFGRHYLGLGAEMTKAQIEVISDMKSPKIVKKRVKK